jgi:GntR family transcriptional regulator, transcriptional repressor for pyruvate dehydrogenase complex
MNSAVDEMRANRSLEFFRPIRLRTAAEEAVLVLIDALRGGLLEVGERLPRERDLAAQMGVSRTVLREAIGILRHSGVVSVRRGPGGGTVVESLAPLHGILAGLQTPTRSSMRSVLEVRRALEFPSMLLTAEAATENDFRELERLVTALDGLFDQPDEFIEADVRFHLVVAEKSRNPLLAELMRKTMNEWSAIRAQYPVGHIDLESARANQIDTLRALKAGKRRPLLRSVDVHLAALEEHFLGETLTLVRAAMIS